LRLAAAGYRVSGIGHGGALPVKGDAVFARGDISRESLRALVADRGAPTLLVHAAGTASVGAAAADPGREEARTLGTLEAVLAVLDETGPEALLVYPSSVGVYGDTGLRPAPEDSPLRPQSYYGELKRAAEEMCLAGADRRCVVLRLSSLYGMGLRKQLLWDLSTRLMRGESVLTLGGTGSETRDFLHGADAAALVELVAARAAMGRTILNAGSGETLTIRDAAQALLAAWNATASIRFNGSVRRGDPAHLQPALDAVRALGFSPQRRFHPSLIEYVSWVRSGAST
jgi:UDP-glucose 4-epimerase